MGMRELDYALEEARRIAGQPVGDKLDGKQGTEARDIVLRLLEEAGLDYAEGLRLMSAFEWHSWRQGWKAGNERTKEN
jgi:hypothetical protein